MLLKQSEALENSLCVWLPRAKPRAHCKESALPSYLPALCMPSPVHTSAGHRKDKNNADKKTQIKLAFMEHQGRGAGKGERKAVRTKGQKPKEHWNTTPTGYRVQGKVQ